MARIGDSLQSKNVVITQSESYMGPILCSTFRDHGANVIAHEPALIDPQAPQNLIDEVGVVDVLIVNLAIEAPHTRAEDVQDEEWRDVFAHLVDPLPRLCRAVLPQMIERRAGKIVVIGSAAAMRGLKRYSTYCAARGAQLSYVQAVGIEVAPHNVQVNLIAQNFVDNPTYFPAELKALDAFKDRLAREVPAGRLATQEEDALFAVFLASSEVNFFVGQAIPFSGGWIT